MKIEKIRKINKSKIIIGGLIGLGVISAITILPSYSKYRTTQSFNLVKGKITYKQPDFNLVAMYTIENGTEQSIDTVPLEDDGSYTYTLNTSRSECTYNGEKVGTISYNNGYLTFSQINKKGTKCNVYFNKVKKPEVLSKDEIVASATPKDGSFTDVATEEDTGLFSVNDGDGTSYYYRGLVTNNYVSFANKCWRIIRFNGDGSIRIIYDGTACHENGINADSIIQTSVKYNNSANDNAYVGYMYGKAGQSSYANTHANTNSSNIKTVLDNWYTTNIANAGFSSYIDSNAGFCNDRKLGSRGNGYSTNQTFYEPRERLYDTSSNSFKSPQEPILTCSQNNDLFTPTTSSKGNKKLAKSIGLITADEVVFAGGLYTKASKNYWLYNGQYYWTMSPGSFPYSSTPTTASAYVFSMSSDGTLNNGGVDSASYGVRPVINLKVDTLFDGDTNGTLNNPYKIVD